MKREAAVAGLASEGLAMISGSAGAGFFFQKFNPNIFQFPAKQRELCRTAKKGLHLPSGARALFPCARVRLNRLLLRPLFVRHPRPLGRIPFPFLPCPLPSFLHLLFIHLPSSRLFLFLPPHPYHPCLRFLHHFTLFFFTFVKSHNVLCLVLS